MKMHVKKNDLVVVLCGNDRGKRGKILSVNPASRRVVVEGIRMIKKAVRKSETRPNGGFQEREAAIDASNVMLAESYDKRHKAEKQKAA